MSFAMLSDDLLARLEHDGISRDARHLYVEGIVHCATALTDGDIRVRLARISDADDPDALADQLVRAGYWQRTDDGYVITDYLKHNRRRDAVIASRESNRQRQEDYRERGRLHREGDHSKCTSNCPDKGVTRDVTGDVTAPLPHLTSPNHREVREVREDGPDGALGRAPDPSDDEPLSPHLLHEGCCNLPAENARHFTAPAKVLALLERLNVDQSRCVRIDLADEDERRRYADTKHVITIVVPHFRCYVYTSGSGRIGIIQAWAEPGTGVDEDFMRRFRERHEWNRGRVGSADDGSACLMLTGRNTEDDLFAVLTMPEVAASEAAA